MNEFVLTNFNHLGNREYKISPMTIILFLVDFQMLKFICLKHRLPILDCIQ